MVLTPRHCPTCHSTDVVKHGKTSNGKQRWFCRNPDCAQQTFLTTYVYKGRLREVKQQIIDMAMNGSGIPDRARVLHISPTSDAKHIAERVLRARFVQKAAFGDKRNV